MKVTGLKNKIVDINKKVTSSVENYIKTKASAIAARFSLGAKVEGALKAAEAAQKALAIAQEAAFQLAEDAAEAAADTTKDSEVQYTIDPALIAGSGYLGDAA